MSKSNFEFLKGANDILFNMALAAEKTSTVILIPR